MENNRDATINDFAEQLESDMAALEKDERALTLATGASMWSTGESFRSTSSRPPKGNSAS